MDSEWFNLVKYDSAVVSMNDGTSVALYRRDPEKYRDLLKRTIDIHRRFRSANGRSWPSNTAKRWVTSPRRRLWEKTFEPWTKSQ